jgi:hypothetical protein
MKLRTTLLLALIGGGLFTYIWFVERHQDSTREAEEASAKVVRLEREKIQHLSLHNGATLIELHKKDGVWMMEQPIADQADAGAIERILSLLEGLRHDAKIELTKGKEAEMLKEFGVDESQLSLKLKSDTGKDVELLVGKDSAVAGKLYVRQQGQKTVFVIRKELRTQMTAQPDDFRDHNLSGTQASAVQRFSIKTADGEVELQRKNNHWDILKPLRARAADSKINDLLAGLLTAQVSSFYRGTRFQNKVWANHAPRLPSLSKARRNRSLSRWAPLLQERRTSKSLSQNSPPDRRSRLCQTRRWIHF